MDFELRFDQDFIKVKERLNRDKIKLWLPPYVDDRERKVDAEFEALVEKYSQELNIPPEKCMQLLDELQSVALDNVKQKNDYKNTGYATIKIRIPNSEGEMTTVVTSMKLEELGKCLLDSVGKLISIPRNRLKLIFRGKVLSESLSLESQGVKHGMHMMGIVLQENKEELVANESRVKLLEDTKADIEFLENNQNDDNDDDHYLQVADQSGKLLTLPPSEKKALVMAMTLHEKGRTALKKGDHFLSLVLLLGAEKEFSRCNSSLLKSVDNYAVLSLDIAWCYLNLESVTQLPEAEEKLRQCEMNFHQSYGPNLERLIALKGTDGNEAALFMRLHLLQAIVLYHKNKIEQAQTLWKRAETELNGLKIDDSQLSHLIELGYTAAEARLALRGAKGDINMAISIIENRREERRRNEAEEEEKRKLNREKRKLGKCVDGKWIEPQFHKSLCSMGYSYETARWALAQTNNSISESVSLIQEHPERLPAKKIKISEASIEQVTAMGFNEHVAKIALRKHDGDVTKAVEELVSSGGFILDISDTSSSTSSEGSKESPSTSSSHKLEEAAKKAEAYSRIAEGVSGVDDDHLDLTLVQEEAFLMKYKSLIFKP